MPDSYDTVRSVHCFSTGWAEQHREHRFGSSMPRLWWALTSRSWVDLPINAFAIEHREGLVLFDCGMDPSIATNPNYVSSPIGRFLLRRLFRFHIGPADDLPPAMTPNPDGIIDHHDLFVFTRMYNWFRFGQ